VSKALARRYKAFNSRGGAYFKRARKREGTKPFGKNSGQKE
jgi:hypothetical protein